MGRYARDVISALPRRGCCHELVEHSRTLHAMLHASRYQEQLYFIFFQELLPEHWARIWKGDEEDPRYSRTLDFKRRQAMDFAGMQRVANAFVRAHTLEEWAWNSVKRASLEVSAQQLPDLLSISHSPSLRACAWLKQEKSLRPHYVWDVEAQRTVRANEIEDLDYICISHTWGRFRIANESANIFGVPWPVPRNSLFDVTLLPAELARVFRHGYIWMDLFCIPQNRNELARQEISRQGAIFQNAKVVVGWINSFTDWTVVQSVLLWLSLLYLYGFVDVLFCYGDRIPDHVVYPYYSDAKSQLPWKELLFDEPNPHAWLTSLWILQEACLRPDMVMVNEKWAPLVANNDTLVTLKVLLNLVDFVAKIAGLLNGAVRGPPQHLPECYQSDIDSPLRYSCHNKAVQRAMDDFDRPRFRELRYLCKALRGSNFSCSADATVPEILSIARSRIVSDKGQLARAESIMAAVAATAWYPKHPGQNSTRDWSLIFGSFPLEFFQEVIQKHRFSVYICCPSSLDFLEGAVTLGQKQWLMIEGHQPVGSMLFFLRRIAPHTNVNEVHGIIHRWVERVPGFESGLRPSVSTWDINADGSVTIHRVTCLVASQLGLWPLSEKAMIIVPGEETGRSLSYKSPFMVYKEQHVQQWLQSFSPAYPDHAVVVGNGPNAASEELYYGVLLKRIDEEDGTTLLIKVGVFITPKDPCSAVVEREVDWLVL